MPRIALHPAPAQEEQKILAVAAVLEFLNSLLGAAIEGERKCDLLAIKPMG